LRRAKKGACVKPFKRSNLKHGKFHRHRGPSAIRRPRFNWRVSDFIRGMMVRWFELRARITGRAYYCSTLAGQEDYNLTVNSDLTVSCTCQDLRWQRAHRGPAQKYL